MLTKLKFFGSVSVLAVDCCNKTKKSVRAFLTASSIFPKSMDFLSELLFKCLKQGLWLTQAPKINVQHVKK